MRDVKVVHNTIYSHDASYVRSIHLLDDVGEGLIRDVVFAHNIIRGRIKDNTLFGGFRLVGNLHGWKESPDGPWRGTPIEESWFVDVGAGDLHLTGGAAAAIDAAEPLAEVPGDIDGSRRPVGKGSDVGADEYQHP